MPFINIQHVLKKFDKPKSSTPVFDPESHTLVLISTSRAVIPYVRYPNARSKHVEEIQLDVDPVVEHASIARERAESGHW